jgi:hypothetical protein
MSHFVPEECRVDPEFEGSIHQEIGQSKYLCPRCQCHLRESHGNLICLNACHLSASSQRRFREEMKDLSK